MRSIGTNYIERSLLNKEIQRYKNFSLTEHAKQRMDERVKFTNLSSRIAKCKLGYIDYDGASHIFLQYDNVEIIGRYIHGVFEIITVIPMGIINFNYKMKKKTRLK